VGKYVLCCTDCHEPHGSPNEFLLRTEVNGRTGISTEPPEYYDHGQWEDLCDSCHPETGGYMLGPCGIINGCHDHGSGDF
jgi:hypothetical protein